MFLVVRQIVAGYAGDLTIRQPDACSLDLAARSELGPLAQRRIRSVGRMGGGGTDSTLGRTGANAGSCNPIVAAETFSRLVQIHLVLVMEDFLGEER
jgi:hypothetical protein